MRNKLCFKSYKNHNIQIGLWNHSKYGTVTSHRYLPKASVIEAFAKKNHGKKKKTTNNQSPNVLALVGLKLYKNLENCRPQKDLLSLQNSVHHLATPFYFFFFWVCLSARQKFKRRYTKSPSKNTKKKKNLVHLWQGPLCCSEQDGCRESVKLGAKPSSSATGESNGDVVATRVGCRLFGSVKYFAQK